MWLKEDVSRVCMHVVCVCVYDMCVLARVCIYVCANVCVYAVNYTIFSTITFMSTVSWDIVS